MNFRSYFFGYGLVGGLFQILVLVLCTLQQVGYCLWCYPSLIVYFFHWILEVRALTRKNFDNNTQSSWTRYIESISTKTNRVLPKDLCSFDVVSSLPADSCMNPIEEVRAVRPLVMRLWWNGPQIADTDANDMANFAMVNDPKWLGVMFIISNIHSG